MARINSTATVRVALWALRIYLLLLLTLIGIKFTRVWDSARRQGAVATTASTTATNLPAVEIRP